MTNPNETLTMTSPTPNTTLNLSQIFTSTINNASENDTNITTHHPLSSDIRNLAIQPKLYMTWPFFNATIKSLFSGEEGEDDEEEPIYFRGLAIWIIGRILTFNNNEKSDNDSEDSQMLLLNQMESLIIAKRIEIMNCIMSIMGMAKKKQNLMGKGKGNFDLNDEMEMNLKCICKNASLLIMLLNEEETFREKMDGITFFRMGPCTLDKEQLSLVTPSSSKKIKQKIKKSKSNTSTGEIMPLRNNVSSDSNNNTSRAGVTYQNLMVPYKTTSSDGKFIDKNQSHLQDRNTLYNTIFYNRRKRKIHPSRSQEEHHLFLLPRIVYKVLHRHYFFWTKQNAFHKWTYLTKQSQQQTNPGKLPSSSSHTLSYQKEAAARTLRTIYANIHISLLQSNFHKWISHIKSLREQERLEACIKIQTQTRLFQVLSKLKQTHLQKLSERFCLSPLKKKKNVQFYIHPLVRKERRKRWFSSIKIQSIQRMLIPKRSYQNLLMRCVQVQSIVRQFLSIRRVSHIRQVLYELFIKQQKKSATKIQSICRRYLFRKYFLYTIEIAIPTIQRSFRVYAAKLKVFHIKNKNQIEFNSALKIQLAWYHLRRNQFSTFCLLCCLRVCDELEDRKVMRERRQFRNQQAITIQRYYLFYRKRKRFLASTTIQKIYRGYSSWLLVQTIKKRIQASIKIQKVVRKWCYRRDQASLKIAFVWLVVSSSGRIVKHFYLVRQKIENEASLKIQSISRMFLAEIRVHKMKIKVRFQHLTKKVWRVMVIQKKRNKVCISKVSRNFTSCAYNGGILDVAQSNVLHYLESIQKVTSQVVHTFWEKIPRGCFDIAISQILGERRKASYKIQSTYENFVLRQKAQMYLISLKRRRRRRRRHNKLDHHHPSSSCRNSSIPRTIQHCINQIKFLYYPSASFGEDKNIIGLSLGELMRRCGFSQTKFSNLEENGIVTTEQFFNLILKKESGKDGEGDYLLLSRLLGILVSDETGGNDKVVANITGSTPQKKKKQQRQQHTQNQKSRQQPTKQQQEGFDDPITQNIITTLSKFIDTLYPKIFCVKLTNNLIPHDDDVDDDNDDSYSSPCYPKLSEIHIVPPSKRKAIAYSIFLQYYPNNEAKARNFSSITTLLEYPFTILQLKDYLNKSGGARKAKDKANMNKYLLVDSFGEEEENGNMPGKKTKSTASISQKMRKRMKMKRKYRNQIKEKEPDYYPSDDENEKDESGNFSPSINSIEKFWNVYRFKKTFDLVLTACEEMYFIHLQQELNEPNVVTPVIAVHVEYLSIAITMAYKYLWYKQDKRNDNGFTTRRQYRKRNNHHIIPSNINIQEVTEVLFNAMVYTYNLYWASKKLQRNYYLLKQTRQTRDTLASETIQRFIRVCLSKSKVQKLRIEKVLSDAKTSYLKYLKTNHVEETWLSLKNREEEEYNQRNKEWQNVLERIIIIQKHMRRFVCLMRFSQEMKNRHDKATIIQGLHKIYIAKQYVVSLKEQLESFWEQRYDFEEEGGGCFYWYNVKTEEASWLEPKIPYRPLVFLGGTRKGEFVKAWPWKKTIKHRQRQQQQHEGKSHEKSDMIQKENGNTDNATVVSLSSQQQLQQKTQTALLCMECETNTATISCMQCINELCGKNNRGKHRQFCFICFTNTHYHPKSLGRQKNKQHHDYRFIPEQYIPPSDSRNMCCVCGAQPSTRKCLGLHIPNDCYVRLHKLIQKEKEKFERFIDNTNEKKKISMNSSLQLSEKERDDFVKTCRHYLKLPLSVELLSSTYERCHTNVVQILSCNKNKSKSRNSATKLIHPTIQLWKLFQKNLQIIEKESSCKHENNNLYCKKCWVDTHPQNSSRFNHKWYDFDSPSNTSASFLQVCVECQTYPAELTCLDCQGDLFCYSCFRNLHGNGKKRRLHKFQKLDWVNVQQGYG